MKKLFLSLLSLLLFASYGMAQTESFSNKGKAVSVEKLKNQKKTLVDSQADVKKITDNQILATKLGKETERNAVFKKTGITTQKSNSVTSLIPFQQDIFEGERIEMERLKQSDANLYSNYLNDRDAIADLMSQEKNGTISSDSLEKLNIFRTTYGLE